jgi:hypothetical protein
MTEPPPQASVVEYPYLWRDQEQHGETEGRKARPVCLALSVRSEQTGEHHLLLLAISSQPPRAEQSAIEIPETERRRSGLTRYPTAWIVTSEYNYDIAERSFYYDPVRPVLGRFSPRFMRQIAAALRQSMLSGGARISRID